MKIGRNERCHCDSGKKYKHCHGNLTIQKLPSKFEEGSRKAQVQYELLQKQRIKQQGLGKPINSVEVNGVRTVFVGNNFYSSPKWKTFHDFLIGYLPNTLGIEWANNELKKTDSDIHPIIEAYRKLCEYQTKVIKEPGEVVSVPPNGAVELYMCLSYNLYIIAHNSSIDERLIKRLKNKKQFLGAYYETYVAANFIKAGFTLEFEDESDRDLSHCEFVATHIATGKHYCVEAKMRERLSILSPQSNVKNYELDIGIKRLLFNALKKNAQHERIVFIDMNLPAYEAARYVQDDFSKFIENAELEYAQHNEINTPAYVFLTNYCYHYHIDTFDFGVVVTADGFNISDFGSKKFTLEQGIASQEKHASIINLFRSFEEQTWIPSTFDGSIPEYALNGVSKLYSIGDTLNFVDNEGKSITGEIIDVVPSNNDSSIVYCLRTSDLATHLVRIELSEAQKRAYRNHPDTIFGVYKPKNRILKTQLDAYNFFMKSVLKTPKNEILECLKTHPNYQSLISLPQPELAKIHCRNMVENAVSSGAMKF